MSTGFIARFTHSSLAGLLALTLTGCFNNVSGLSSATSKSSQSNTLLNDGGFANETGTIDANAVLIGTYNDTGGQGYGIMIDLQKTLVGVLGATSLQTILDGIDANTAMQSRSVIIHLPTFGIKATTTLGKLAAANGKKLRNIMNIRPRLARIDLTTSAVEIPGSPAVLQLKNANKTVVTYGGMIESDYVRRMTVLIPFAGQNASFLPSTTPPAYGDGYPANSPEEVPNAVKLVRVTQAIADHFANIITKPPYGASIYSSITSTAIRAISQTRDALALAVHYARNVNGGYVYNLNNSKKIEAAYLININPADTNGPEIFPFCLASYDNQEQTATYTPNGTTSTADIDFTHPLACNCLLASCAARSTSTVAPTASQFVDPWDSRYLYQNPALVDLAVLAEPVAPTGGPIVLSPNPYVLNDFVLTPN